MAHLHREVVEGAYPAQETAAETLDGLRSDLGRLTGLPAPGVLLVDSATTGLRILLHAWGLPEQARIGVTPSEWGPNLRAFEATGHHVVGLDVGGDGILDLDALGRRLATDPPDVVHLVHAASHRGLVQPVAAASALCRDAGVPLWVDVAQAIGHHDVRIGADAAYAPGRKWLRGPRGTGFLAVDPRHTDVLLRVDGWQPGDLSVAAAVGLAHAVAELRADDGTAVRTELAARGARLRDLLADVPRWQVADGPGGGGALVGLRPLAGQDVERVQAELLAAHRVLTTACLPWRSPGDMHVPLLRLAPHVDVADSDLARVADLLAGI